MRQEALHVECSILAQHEIDGAAELRGQDREGFGLAVATREASLQLLAFGVAAKEEHGGFGEGPLEVDVPDLGSSGPELLARRGVVTLHEPRVGEEVLDLREAAHVVDLVEDREGQDLAETVFRR